MNEYTYNILNDVYIWMVKRDKDVEVRILKEKSEKIGVGDYITFYNLENPSKYVKVLVTNKVIVDNLDELISIYTVNRIMPGHSFEELKNLMNEIYGEDLLSKKIVAFEFKYLFSDIDEKSVK